VLSLLLTAGEPAGIGPDLCLALALNDASPTRPLLIAGCPETLRERAALLGLKLEVRCTTPAAMANATATAEVLATAGQRATASDATPIIHCWPFPAAVRVVPGQLNPRNAPSVLAMLRAAALAAAAGEVAAIVTAPVQKSVIADAGIPFTGHTEFLAELFADASGTACPVVMLLVADTLRVALATTHLPLRAVPDALTQEGLLQTLRILDSSLRTRFAITTPRIAVLGLNPHAGEGGHLGHEDAAVIAPAIATARAAGIHAFGPLPADTAFTPKALAQADAVLAMFHDQGLPVLKHVGFGAGVNVTLGLPIIRTSVDHGTALDLAGTGKADTGSLAAAVALANTLTNTLANTLANSRASTSTSPAVQA
jgi:4-hydroxythreonine-4-phosphate dehydrogenase